MSGTPSKRLHEEAAAGNTGGGAHASGSSAGYPVPKLGQGSEFHHSHPPPDHMGQHQQQQDVRMPPKIPRNDPSRSPLPPVYHHHRNVSSSAPHSEVNPEVVAASETTRLEFKDNPSRDSKSDGRELYQSGKGDERERDSYKDFDYPKAEKEGFGAGNSHLNWKESSKDHHRGKRYPDAQGGGGNLDPWHVSRGNMHAPGEKEVVSKEGSTVVEERDGVDARETVGENRVDLKGEDRFRDKDRKRKDLKHRDWGEKDKDRIERRNSLQIGGSNGDGKEPSKEERETDRWERERKDLPKDKERLKEREKDHTKREAWIVAEKDVPHNEKEPGDVPGSTSEPDHLLTEQKKQKDHDGWKNGDREVKDRRKERDADTEGERPEKRSRGYEKESDDGYADADGGGDKERESFNYGVQQRKRMLRPRGSPQVGNREPRIKSRTQDNEGSQGKSEASTVVYRVGEYMQELTNLWKEYKSSQADKGAESSQNGPTLEIRIPAEHVTATNRQVRGGQLWGTDVYTDDSDLVAVLMHTGYCRPTASPPPSAIQELRATVRVLPPQDCYISTLRNNVRSRSWGAAIGCSIRVERCCIVKKGGGTVDLEPCLTHTSTVEPTLAPVAVERTMTTRAAASNALRQQRFVREVTIQYNLCSEPWIKYSLSIVADKGLKKPLYTSARLKKGEVLYVETRSRRYELCFAGEKMVKATAPLPTHDKEIEKSQTHNLHTANGERVGALDGESVSTDVFRWSFCKKPLPQDEMRSIGIPLPLEHLEVLAENVDWEDIQWSQTGVFIAGKEYPLARMHFISPN